MQTHFAQALVILQIQRSARIQLQLPTIGQAQAVMLTGAGTVVGQARTQRSALPGQAERAAAEQQ